MTGSEEMKSWGMKKGSQVTYGSGHGQFGLCLCGDSFIQSIVKVTQIVMGIVLVLCICHTVYTIFFLSI